jgi:anti-sigma B factor antagonist
MADNQQSREAASIDDRGLRPPAAFTIRLRDDAPVLVLEGELDLAAAPELRRRVDEFRGDALVLDFKRSTFIDSAVLKELLRANVEMARYETRVVLADVPPPVRRLLDLTRTAQLFTIAPDRASAVRQLEG